MPVFAPDFLADASGGRWFGPSPQPVESFGIDTRTLPAQACFVALRTDRRDGHDYLEAALNRQASAAIVSRVRPEVPLPQLLVEDSATALQAIAKAHRRRFKGHLIGITGSCGKTSTKELLALLLAPQGVHKTPGNLNNLLGVPLTLLGLDNDLHRFGVVEAGMNQPGEMAILGGLMTPDTAIVTMVGPAHLEGVGSLEGIAHEKSALLAHVRPAGLGLFPQSCLAYSAFQKIAARCLVLEEVSATPHSSSPKGSLPYLCEPTGNAPEAGFDLRFPTLGAAFKLPSMSKGMLGNCALALALGLRLGLEVSHLQERLELWQAPAQRGQILIDGSDRWWVDCYNANPASMLDTIDAFARRFRTIPRIYILGGMKELGSSSAHWHAHIGRSIPCQPQDRIFLVGPEMKDAWQSARNALPLPADQILCFEDAEQLRTSLQPLLGQGTAILLKGSRFYRLETLLPNAVQTANPSSSTTGTTC